MLGGDWEELAKSDGKEPVRRETARATGAEVE
jgi:hypothetical protein